MYVTSTTGKISDELALYMSGNIDTPDMDTIRAFEGLLDKTKKIRSYRLLPTEIFTSLRECKCDEIENPDHDQMIEDANLLGIPLAITKLYNRIESTKDPLMLNDDDRESLPFIVPEADMKKIYSYLRDYEIITSSYDQYIQKFPTVDSIRVEFHMALTNARARSIVTRIPE